MPQTGAVNGPDKRRLMLMLFRMRVSALHPLAENALATEAASKFVRADMVNTAKVYSRGQGNASIVFAACAVIHGVFV